MYNPWVSNKNNIWRGNDTIDEVICDTWGWFIEETRDTVNVVPDILHHNIDSYIKYWNAIHVTDHEDNVDTTINSGDGADEYEVIGCDINNNLGTV